MKKKLNQETLKIEINVLKNRLAKIDPIIFDSYEDYLDSLEKIKSEITVLESKIVTEKPVKAKKEVKPVSKYTKEYIREKLKTSDLWLVKGLIAIYNYQTENEKNSGTTNQSNGVGFNGVDAEILTSFAEQVLNRTSEQASNDYKRFESSLSVKQKEITRKLLPKYSGQLLRLCN
jgi:hypothetical protein